MAGKKSNKGQSPVKGSEKNVAAVALESKPAVSDRSDVVIVGVGKCEDRVIASGEWNPFGAVDMLPSVHYLVGCSRTKKQAYVKRVGGDLVGRGVYLDWVPDKILVVPEL